MADPLTCFVRQVDRLTPGGVRLLKAQSMPWASATFIGSRHALTLGVPLPEIERLAESVGEMEFDLPGHLVADVRIVSVTKTEDEGAIAMEILTVEQC
jgi:hypothetical protein